MYFIGSEVWYILINSICRGRERRIDKKRGQYSLEIKTYHKQKHKHAYTHTHTNVHTQWEKEREIERQRESKQQIKEKVNKW